jgi:Uma2 family endonuclease
MTQAKTRFITLEQYAALDPSELPEGHYELVNGELVEMGAENPGNVATAIFLISVFLQLAIPYNQIHRGTEIAVTGRGFSSRYPDLMILTEAGWQALSGSSRSLITKDMPAPLLVIEVVSPGEPGSKNYDRDYVDKPSEYAARGIPEFWQVDPDLAVVTVLRLENGVYRSREFRGGDRIVSPTFPELVLMAEQILSAGR